MECLFCKIGRKEIPSEIVFENPGSIAFLDIHPCAPGHAVVIPKRHAVTILDCSDREIASLFTAVREVTARIQKALGAEGFTIGLNHGSSGYQAVPHVHIHVMPGTASLAEIALKIRNC